MRIRIQEISYVDPDSKNWSGFKALSIGSAMLSFPLRSVVWAIPPRPLYLCFHNFIITLYFPSLHPNKRPAINPAAIASPTHIYFKIRKLFNILVSFFKKNCYTFINIFSLIVFISFFSLKRNFITYYKRMFVACIV